MSAPAIGCRVVVADPPGEATTLTIYADVGALASVQLDPASAVGLAGDLIEAARVRLGRARSSFPPASQGTSTSRSPVG